jgi:PAS domain S-box-containing protein
VPRSLTDLVGLDVSAADFLAAVLEAAAQPIWVVDPGGVIRFANPAAFAALGYDSADELVGCHSHETIHYQHPDGTPYPAAECPMLLPRTTGEVVKRDLDWFFRRDGSMFPVSYVSVPLEMPGGRGAVVAFNDIEDRLRAARELRERDEVLAAQQAALRRLATLVARGAPPAEMFEAVIAEIGRLLPADAATLGRYENDDTLATIGFWSSSGEARIPIGGRHPLEPGSLPQLVRDSGRPARVDAYSELAGSLAQLARDVGWRSSVGAPVIVGGRVWGLVGVASTTDRPLPPDTEERVAAFAELLATAIAHAQSREDLTRLAEEQAALRRVATLVAEGAPPGVVLDTAVGEMQALLEAYQVALNQFVPHEEILVLAHRGLDLDRSPVGSRVSIGGESARAKVRRTGRPARMENYEFAEGDLAKHARATGVRSSVSVPVTVEGRVWGLITASWKGEQVPPPETEERMSKFAELLDTAIAGAEARAQIERLAQEQAALRRVATLVARESSPAEVFGTVAEELAQLLGTEGVGMLRFEPDGAATLVAQSNTPWEPIPLGTRFALEGENVITTVFRTRRAARLDDWSNATGAAAAMAHTLGIRSSVATPIVVEGRLWGTMVAVTRQVEPLPADTESRIGKFTKLLATAISNAEARGELSRLAEEQAALRRVATLVAEGVESSELFGAVVEEVGRLLEADLTGMIRYVSDDAVAPVATSAADGEHPEVHGEWPLDGDRIATTILRTRRPAREDDWARAGGPIADFVLNKMGVRSSVGSPIVVEGQVWGALFVHSKHPQEPLPPDTEARLTNFAELVATAISNAQARAEVGRLADEQAALRRVATLVAQERSPAEVFAAVAEEIGRVLQVEDTRMIRYEPDGTATITASWGKLDAELPVGTNMAVGGENISTWVFRTGRAARKDYYDDASGALGDRAHELGVRSAVGTPIIVGGRLWGAMITASMTAEPLPVETEARMGQFTELVATAISNIEARSDLAASRARIVAATDEARRRFERDLHDGVQQRLVSLSLELRSADTLAPLEHEELRGQLARVGEGLSGVLDDLRELSRGIHPAILSEGGLGPALKALARRSVLPTKLEVSVERRLDEQVEVTAYYVVSEALANATKHARASVAEVHVEARNGVLDLTIHDDGVGGADPARGSGLVGLADRVEALGGAIGIESPDGAGTSVHVELPVNPTYPGPSS